MWKPSIWSVIVVASAFALAGPITDRNFVIDSSKPYVYVKFDHIGNRKPAAEGEEESKVLWLRLVNNCNLPITVRTFDLGTGVPGVGVNYSVVPVSGILRSPDAQVKKIPTGYDFDVGTLVEVAPGENLLFSIPLDRVSPRWFIQVRFDLALPGPKNGYEPYSLVDFSWEDIPEKERAP